MSKLTLTHYFEKERFTELQYHLDYDSSQDLKPLDGDSYHEYIDRIRLQFICRKLVAQNYNPPFFIDQKHRYYRAKSTWLGVWILEFLANHNARTRDKSYDHMFNQYSPDLEIMMQIADAALSRKGSEVNGIGDIKPLPLAPTEYEFAEGAEGEEAVRAYAGLASQMRVALHTGNIKTAVKNFRRNAIERRKHLMRVTHQIWERHSSILLIRLDWGYKNVVPIQPNDLTGRASFEARMSEVNRYRQLMLTSLRGMFQDDLAFYAWKIEYGETAGIHIHWLLGLDSTRLRRPYYAGTKIQKAWDTAIANEHTYTFNLNGMSNAERSGLRVIDSQDPERWEIVTRHVDYLLKGDHTLKLRTPKGMRAFGSSKAVTPRTN